MVRRTLALLFLVLVLVSCKPKTIGTHAVAPEKESPVITSLKDSGLPCFGCHSYEKFSADNAGKFSHTKHLRFGVHCNQCHLIKPHREMALNRETCDNCHNLKTLAYAGSGMPVNFSHQGHSKRSGCGECHPSLFRMKKGSTKIVMDDMYKGGTCGKCHNGKIAFNARDCAKCHAMNALKKDLIYSSGSMAPARFSHEFHTAMFGCDSCHPALFKNKKGASGIKMDALYQNKFCGKCHDGTSAFGSSDCERCHK